MTVLDTSSLIRFFTKDNLAKARKVKQLLESGQKLYIPDVVFPELEYVLLGATYNANRQDILAVFQFLTTHPTITVSIHMRQAVGVYQTTRLDMADCIIAATTRGNTLASFDKALINVKNIESYW